MEDKKQNISSGNNMEEKITTKESKNATVVPYFLHESAMARAERTIKRLFIICILLIIVAVGTNAYWIHYESQFEDIAITQDVDTGDSGGDAIINDGVHFNGESETNS